MDLTKGFFGDKSNYNRVILYQSMNFNKADQTKETSTADHEPRPGSIRSRRKKIHKLSKVISSHKIFRPGG